MSKPSSLPIVGAALAQKKKRDTIALIEKLDTMQITAQWINEEFLSARLKLSSQQKTKKTKKTNIFFCWLSACCEEPKSDESPSEQDKQQRIEELSENVYERLTTQKNEELSKKLYERLTDHAIYSHKQLEDVAMQKGGVALLHEILHCKGAAEAISEYYDNLLALQESLAPKLDLVDMLFSWAFTGEHMDAILTNFSVAAALIAGASMANFASITKEDWLAYLTHALREEGCQAKATALCGLEALSPDHLGWAPLYCQKAVDLLIETPTMDLTNASTYPDHPDLSCCMEALECAKNLQWNLEFAYTAGCCFSSAAMLLVIVFSAWIYIALNLSSANRERIREAKLHNERFRGEFLIVFFLFHSGVIFGLINIFTVISLKVGTRGMEWIAYGINMYAAFIALAIIIVIPLKVYRLNQAIDEERGFDKENLVVKYRELLDIKYKKFLAAHNAAQQAEAKEAAQKAPKADEKMLDA